MLTFTSQFVPTCCLLFVITCFEGLSDFLEHLLSVQVMGVISRRDISDTAEAAGLTRGR